MYSRMYEHSFYSEYGIGRVNGIPRTLKFHFILKEKNSIAFTILLNSSPDTEETKPNDRQLLSMCVQLFIQSLCFIYMQAYLCRAFGHSQLFLLRIWLMDRLCCSITFSSVFKRFHNKANQHCRRCWVKQHHVGVCIHLWNQHYELVFLSFGFLQQPNHFKWIHFT